MTLIKNIFISILSLCLIIFILEVSLRYLGDQPRVSDLARTNDPIIYKNDEELGWIHKPGLYYFQPWSKNGKITKFSINDNGSRQIYNNDNATQDYIFIGGSLTQGWAVGDNDNFVSNFKKLNPNLNILNYGTGGYGGYQSMLLQERIIGKFQNIDHFIYGFIDHHEVRNIAAGSWLYLLNKYSGRGHVSVPYASIDEFGELKRNKPINYLKLPFSEKLVLIAKVEKRIMKLKSSSREKQKFEVSNLIIKRMNSNSLQNNSKFTVLLLDINKNNLTKYKKFFKNQKINYIYCPFPLNETIQGEGHPNKIAHKSVAKCLDENLN